MATRPTRPFSSTTGPMNSESEIRKRASKACDRCKLKKIKCCGFYPCARCKSDDAVCFFDVLEGRYTKWMSSSYAKQLQSEQLMLIKAVRALWKRYSDSELAGSNAGAENDICVHSIVQSLGLLDQSHDPIPIESDLGSEEQRSDTSRSADGFYDLQHDVDQTLSVQDERNNRIPEEAFFNDSQHV